MKKFWIGVILFALLFAGGCATANDNGEDTPPEEPGQEQDDEQDVEQNGQEEEQEQEQEQGQGQEQDQNQQQDEQAAEVDQEKISIAQQFMDHLAAEEFEQARLNFDETMAGEVTAEDLAQVWQELQNTLGFYQEHQYLDAQQVEVFSAVFLNGKFENGTVTFSVFLNEANEISGFYIE